MQNESTVISLVVARIGGAMVRVLVSGAVDRGFHKIVNTVCNSTY